MADITDEEVIERVEKWFSKAKAHWEPHHNRFRKIKEFTKCHGDHAQWEDAEWSDRQAVNPPRLTLTENLLGPFVNQVANDLKKSDFGCQVKPRDSQTTTELAEVRQSLHRGVQQIGGFADARDRMIDDLIDGGIGAMRFVTKYADPESMNKEIDYLECDPERLFHGDGTHRKPDFSDVEDSLYYQPYSKERFKAEFDKDPESFLGRGDAPSVWGSQASEPWVSEYFFKVETPDTLITCTNDPQLAPFLQMAKVKAGSSYFLSDFKAKVKDLADRLQFKIDDFIAKDENGDRIERETSKCQVWWAKLAHKQVLKKEKWPGYFIPNFVATGREVTINGEKRYYGLPEPAVHVQKAHNYAFSALVERAGQAPKNQTWMAIEGMDPKYQGIYDNLNVWNGVVPYKSRDSKGNAIDRPYREAPIQSDPAFIGLRQMTLQGIRDVLGMWENSLGAQSQEKSGIAIQTRERQSDMGNADWGMHLARTMEHCFNATDEMLDKVYDTPTEILIVGEDDKDEVLKVAALEEGDPNHNDYFDLNRGKYKIICKMSPGADTKREEQLRGMDLLFRNNPQLSGALAPDFIAIQDWKNASKMTDIARAVRATQFPGVDFDALEKGQPQIPPQVQAHMQQQQQQLQQMHEQMQKMQPQMQQITQENQQLKIENQTVKSDKGLESKRLEIDQFNADTARMKAIGELNAKQSNLLLTADKQQHDQLHDNAQAVEQAHQVRHSAAREHLSMGMDAADMAHQHSQGEKQTALAEKKMSQDAALPTGASPGTSSNQDVKLGSP